MSTRSCVNGLACGLFGFSILVSGCGSDSSGGTGGKGGSGGATGGSGGASGGSGGATGGAAGSGGSTPGSYDCSAASGGPPNLKLTEIGSGYERPLFAETAPGEKNRLFIGEQRGVISLIKDGQKVAESFLDISDHVESGGNEQGLLGMAIHPNFAQNHKFYVHYSASGTTAPDGDTMIAEFTVSATNPDKADATSEKKILTQAQPEANHNGGAIHFGADGMLYIGLGDGGGGGDQHGTIGNGQSVDTLLGKILRIDVDNPSGGNNYGIPSGNMTASGALPELWSYGLRNPWRWAFDPCTSDMYIGDVGQNAVEEIDVEPKGKGSGTNYGWRVMEGSTCYNAATCDTSGKELPVAEYTHTDGNCSVTGGYVYRGSAIPGLRGTYIYADYCTSKFWSFSYSAGAAQNKQEITSDITSVLAPGSVSSFGQDQSGEMYVTDFNGKIYRIDSE